MYIGDKLKNKYILDIATTGNNINLNTIHQISVIQCETKKQLTRDIAVYVPDKEIPITHKTKEQLSNGFEKYKAYQDVLNFIPLDAEIIINGKFNLNFVMAEFSCKNLKFNYQNIIDFKLILDKFNNKYNTQKEIISLSDACKHLNLQHNLNSAIGRARSIYSIISHIN